MQSFGPGRRSHIRYWSRSEFIKIASEFGDLTQLGGYASLRTGALHSITSHARRLGYKHIVIYEDNDPAFADMESPTIIAENKFSIQRKNIRKDY